MFALKNLIQIISLTQQHWNPYYPFKSPLFTQMYNLFNSKQKKIVLCFLKIFNLHKNQTTQRFNLVDVQTTTKQINKQNKVYCIYIYINTVKRHYNSVVNVCLNCFYYLCLLVIVFYKIVKFNNFVKI